jgi:hypothetical protein
VDFCIRFRLSFSWLYSLECDLRQVRTLNAGQGVARNEVRTTDTGNIAAVAGARSGAATVDGAAIKYKNAGIKKTGLLPHHLKAPDYEFR